MKQKELVSLIKNKIEYDAGQHSGISEASVLRIIRIVEKNYHEQLFGSHKGITTHDLTDLDQQRDDYYNNRPKLLER